ncbi:unnamed protein product [Ixodes pacificus]
MLRRQSRLRKQRKRTKEEKTRSVSSCTQLAALSRLFYVLCLVSTTIFSCETRRASTIDNTVGLKPPQTSREGKSWEST